MLPVLTVQEIRGAERAHESARPDDPLMLRAAAQLARHMAEMLGPRPGPVVLIVAGPGGNAGDALHAAALLPPSLQAQVHVRAVRGRTHEEGLAACRAAGGVLLEAREAADLLPHADLVVDAVAGLGSRPLEGEAADLARAARDRGVRVLSVDLPSGLLPDSPELPEETFRAERTVTFIAPTLCHAALPAASACGEVHLAPLDLDTGAATAHQVLADELPAWYPAPGATSHKYTRGVVGLATGSVRYPGVAVLGASGALHTGTGMVRHAGGPGQAGADAALARFPSIVLSPGRVQAWVCGSGWDLEDPAARAAHRSQLRGLIAEGCPMVLDAGALDLLPELGPPPPGSLLTPHAGELARLLGRGREEVDADPLGSAREAASRFGASILLKGANQLVADPDGQVLLAVRGPAWTAQAGSGDVLAGSCGALLAAGLPADRAGVLAASLQAAAAALRPGPLPPDALAEHFPEVIARWTRDSAEMPPEVRLSV